MAAHGLEQILDVGAGSQDETLIALDVPYLLVVHIPHYVDAEGAVFLESAWHHDLKQHAAYLPQLRVASPRLSFDATKSDLARVDFTCDFIALPPQRSFREALREFPTTLWAVFQAVGAAQVIHSGVAGWPYPVGWMATLAARLRGKVLFVVIESAPWRILEQASDVGRLARLRADIFERIAVLTCRQADLVVYTQPAFRDSFQTSSRGAGHILPATWITDRHMLSVRAAKSLWRKKLQEPTRFLFAGRLEAFKGIHVLLAALRKLDAAGVEIHLTFFGTGNTEDSIDQAIAGFRHVRVDRRAPVPYGMEFFEIVDEYHALVAPSLGDEQPRILFDAAARGLSVIASDTDGIRPHLRDGETGTLVPPGDEDALAKALQASADDAEGLATRGLAALEYARPFTHAAMHAARTRLFAKYFAPLFGAGAAQ